MPVGHAYYVQGQKLAFPYGERWVSGPFDDSATAQAEADRLRPLYPDATLRVTPRSGKTLPEVRPRGDDRGFTLARVGDRRAAADAIIDLVVRRLGLVVRLEDWNGEPDVDCVTPSLSCNIWLAHTPGAPMPIINWYGAKFPLRGVPGAWAAEFNYWGSKATSLPRDWGELFSMLEIGLLAAVDGTAFDLGAAWPEQRK